MDRGWSWLIGRAFHAQAYIRHLHGISSIIRKSRCELCKKCVGVFRQKKRQYPYRRSQYSNMNSLITALEQEQVKVCAWRERPLPVFYLLRFAQIAEIDCAHVGPTENTNDRGFSGHNFAFRCSRALVVFRAIGAKNILQGRITCMGSATCASNAVHYK